MPPIQEIRLLELCDLGFWYLCVMVLSLITWAYPVVSRIPVHIVTGKLLSILFAFLTQWVVLGLSLHASSTSASAYGTIHLRWWINTHLTTGFAGFLVNIEVFKYLNIETLKRQKTRSLPTILHNLREGCSTMPIKLVQAQPSTETMPGSWAGLKWIWNSKVVTLEICSTPKWNTKGGKLRRKQISYDNMHCWWHVQHSLSVIYF